MFKNVKKKGWVLWEVMLGILLVLILAGGIMAYVPGMRETARVSRAKSEMESFVSMCNVYANLRKDSALPTSLTVLANDPMISAADSIDGIDHGPVFKTGTAFVSPWGTNYIISGSTIQCVTTDGKTISVDF